MSNLIAIAYGCDGSRDPEQNRINHQAMVDELNKLVAEDGWKGVQVTSFRRRRGNSYIEIAEAEDGVLTLDVLRAWKEPEEPAPDAREPEQKGLFN